MTPRSVLGPRRSAHTGNTIADAGSLNQLLPPEEIHTKCRGPRGNFKPNMPSWEAIGDVAVPSCPPHPPIVKAPAAVARRRRDCD
jgi:hypothetical protein